MRMPIEPKPERKRQNTDEKRRRAAADVQLFARQYGRKAQKGVEPNDRTYNEKVEARIKQMRPEDLDELLRYEDE
jgi:hypothetical protein